MPFEVMVAMNVIDEALYQKYRQAMLPILQQHGGGFRYDFVVAKTLQSAADHPVTRVFAIYFASPQQRTAFFANPDYRKIRAQYFDQAVAGRTTIAEYSREE